MCDENLEIWKSASDAILVFGMAEDAKIVGVGFLFFWFIWLGMSGWGWWGCVLVQHVKGEKKTADQDVSRYPVNN